MKKLKKIGVLLLSIFMLSPMFATLGYAALPKEDSISPLWTSIYSVDFYMDFNGTTCCPGVIAYKQSTATSIEGTLTVYEEVGNSWVEVDSWYGISTRGALVLGEDFAATSGVRYKAELYIVAYIGTTPESETFEIIKTCP